MPSAECKFYIQRDRSKGRVYLRCVLSNGVFFKKLRLRSPENTPAFEDEQKRARATLNNEAYGIVVNDAGTRIDEPGYIAESGKFTIWRKDSFGWLVEKYLASLQQRNELFKYTRETNLRAILREPVKPGSPRMFGEYHMRQIRVEHIETLRDRKVQAGMNSAAN
jgi:hypothetical protein